MDVVLLERPADGSQRNYPDSFAPESVQSCVLMFFRQQPNSGGRAGSVTLNQIDITGRFERPVPTPTDASDPAWSPLIPQ